MTKPPIGPFWFDAVTNFDQRRDMWLYCVGVDANTPVALVTGRNEHEACARARLICAALNEDRRKAVAAARKEDGE